jgi:outer membrane protein OmpA-like peptidoglycan-associated protein
MVKKGIMKNNINSPHLSGQGAKIMSEEIDAFRLAKAALYTCYPNTLTNVHISFGDKSIAIYVGQKERGISSYISDGGMRDMRLKRIRQYRDLFVDRPPGLWLDLQDYKLKDNNFPKYQEAMFKFIHWAIHEKSIRDPEILTEALFYHSIYVNDNRMVKGMLDMKNKDDSRLYNELLQTYVRPSLDKIVTPEEQRGGEPQTHRNKVRIAEPLPDRQKFDITGRYEVIYRTNTSKIMGKVMSINQAGNHIEVILSKVLPPSAPVSKYREVLKLNGDLNSDDSFSLIAREDKNKVFRLHPKGNNLELEWNGGKSREIFTKLTDSPVLRELAIKKFRDPVFIESMEWHPLLTNQSEHLRGFFGNPAKIAKFLADFHIQPLLSSKYREERQGEASKKFDDAIYHLVKDPKNGVHVNDYLQIRHHNRLLLSRTLWRPDSSYAEFSQLYYVDDMVALVEQNYKTNPYRAQPYSIQNIKNYVSSSEYSGESSKYKITLNIYGLSFWLGGYLGKITVEKLKGPLKWTRPKEEFKVILGALNLKWDLTIGSDYSGEATSSIPWLPEHIPGEITFVMAGPEVKYGIAGVEAKVGGMRIWGNANRGVLDATFTEVDRSTPDPGDLKDLPDDVKKLKEGKWKDVFKMPDMKAMLAYGWIFKKDEPMTLSDPIEKIKTRFVADYVAQKEIGFKFDSSIVEPSARQALRVLCALELPALMNPLSKLEISGHTDSKGSDSYNYELSEYRAQNTLQAIRDIMGKKFGLYRDFIKVKGFGEEEARKAGEKDFQNLDRRRVDIKLDGVLVLTLREG